MTDQLVWFIATALMITTVLTLGTLGAAGMLGRREDDDPAPNAGPKPVRQAGDPAPAAADHQHAA